MKNSLLICLIIFSFFFGCNSKSDGSVFTNASSEMKASQFQKDSISGTQWMHKIYDSINEPNLLDLSYECYRFNYLDAFGKNKLFRIEHFSESDTRLVVKFYDKDNDYEHEIYTLKSEKTLVISIEQYKEFKSLINGSYFWSMSMFEKPSRRFLDGYAFLLEGLEPESYARTQRYHIVSRQVPYDGSFRKACEKLMEFYTQEMQQQQF